MELPDAETIALCLRKDQQLCREKKLPSTLAIKLSSASNGLLDKIAWYLTPHSEVSKDLRSARCNSIIAGMVAYLSQLEALTGDGNNASNDNFHVTSNSELGTTLKVLDYLRKHKLVPQTTSDDSVSDVILAVREQPSMDSSLRMDQYQRCNRSRQDIMASQTKKRCYICRYQFAAIDAHKLYPLLCRQCGMFNVDCSQLCQKSWISRGKFALVTGGRINLGYSTALMLLRCGANVIVSSRYPADAAARYTTDVDFSEWHTKLKVVGADFRTAKDAFRLVHVVKQLLCTWESRTPSGARQYLDISINNAAQTLTDPIQAELKAFSREDNLQNSPATKLLLATGAGEN